MAGNRPAARANTSRYRPTLLGTVAWFAVAGAASAQQIDIPAPAGSDRFGAGVHVLANGNVVVFDCGNVETGIGSVSLYRPDGSRISTLTGTVAGDCIGSGGLREVGDGHFIVLSPDRRHEGLVGAGAVTWVDGELGLEGQVSAGNSLIGTSMHDRIGHREGILVLGNGNYLVHSVAWDNGDAADAGAVVWADGNTGIAGPVSAANALVGTRTYDAVGSVGGWGYTTTELASGDYVVLSPNLDLDGRPDAGAVTFGSGSSGIRGEVGADNSLVGAQAADRIGERRVVLLADGRYVLVSPYVDRGSTADVGALTWIDGPGPLHGTVNGDNSLLGLHADDQLGRVLELANGNLAVGVPLFGPDDVGAVLVLASDALPTGVLDPGPALRGSQTGDRVGSRLEALANGHFVTATRTWRNGSQANAGAVTWVDGWTGLAAEVAPDNSLVGSLAGDAIAEKLVVLPDSRYAVISPYWSSPTVYRAGAVTIGDGQGGRFGPLSVANSLTGGRANDLVGYGGVTVLENGNLAVLSPRWSSDDALWAGAVTWMAADLPVVGPASSANSLVGGAFQDGSGMRLFALANGHLVAAAPGWDHGATADVGAITWIDGTSGLAGAISADNSLIGTNTGDFPIETFFGSPVVWPLANGNYVVNAKWWDGWGGLLPDQGAVIWRDGRHGTSAMIAPGIALVGTVEADAVGDVHVHGNHYVVTAPGFDGAGVLNGGAVALLRGGQATTGPLQPSFAVFGTTTVTEVSDRLRYAYDPARDLLVVGRPADRIVSLLRIDLLLVSGFD